MKHHSLPLSALTTWCHLNSISLHGIEIAEHITVRPITSASDTAPDYATTIDKGGGLVSTTQHGPGEVLLRVPGDMVLNLERVKEARRVDPLFDRVVDAVESESVRVREEEGRGENRRVDWVQIPYKANLYPLSLGVRVQQTPRGAILLFLLYQMTVAFLESNSPENGTSKKTSGLQTSLTDYVSFLPKDIPLPTFYNEHERHMLLGTSLSDALDQKLVSLEREFELLRTSTENIDWCQRAWWDEGTGGLTFDDWKLVDAMYRSRALELPKSTGDAMVPVVDMANHASDGRSNARFEVDDADGSVLLVVRDDKEIMQGEEVTIMYGAGGACEMVFSYGFLDEDTSSAREMFLGLEMPFDDPLRVAKIRFSDEAPGVKLYIDNAGALKWESDFVWWACVNEEDGLNFRVVQSHDGQRELQATWKGEGFQSSELKSLIMKDVLRDIFVLRATVLIQQRVEEQGVKLASAEQEHEEGIAQSGVVESIRRLVSRLRDLELELVATAFNALEHEKVAVLSSEVVSRYFEGEAEQNAEHREDDFS